MPFAHHAGVVGGGHLAAHRAFDDAADLFQVVAKVARFFRQKRRIGRDAIENAERGDGFDVLDAAGVNEELHRGNLPFHR